VRLPPSRSRAASCAYIIPNVPAEAPASTGTRLQLQRFTRAHDLPSGHQIRTWSATSSSGLPASEPERFRQYGGFVLDTRTILYHIPPPSVTCFSHVILFFFIFVRYLMLLFMYHHEVGVCLKCVAMLCVSQPCVKKSGGGTWHGFHKISERHPCWTVWEYEPSGSSEKKMSDTDYNPTREKRILNSVALADS